MGKCTAWGMGLLVIAMATVTPARAEDASTQAAAEALFREGRALMDQGQYARACRKLKESQRLDPGAGTQLNLAACYEKNGQTASAWATYREAASAAARSDRADWEKVARERASRLEPTLSTLTIVVPEASDLPGLEVERDGVKVARAQWGAPIPVDPGLHPVAATAPRKQQWSTTVTVGANAAKASVAIPPLPLEQGQGAGTPAAPPPRPPAAHPGTGETDAGATDGSGQRTWGLVLGGVGIAGLATGSVLGLMAKSKHDEALDYCDTNNRCTEQGLSLDDDARARATASTVLFGVGAASLVGGAVLYLTAPDGDTPGVALGAQPTRDGASLSMQGVW